MNATQKEAVQIIRNAVEARKAYSVPQSSAIPGDITERLKTAAVLAQALYPDLRATGCSIQMPTYPLVKDTPDNIKYWSFHALEDFVKLVT